jgi:hypothetical protein
MILPSKSNALLTSIPSLIASYVGEDENLLQKTEEAVGHVWRNTWQEANPEQFVGWLLQEGVFDLREIAGHTSPNTVNLFSKTIVPLLLEASSSSLEKNFLYDLANRLKATHAFVQIFPSIGNEPKFDSQCIAIGQNNDFSQKVDGSGPIDSYWIQLNLTPSLITLMADDQGAWHFGSPSPLSFLLHELAHVLDGVTDPQRYCLQRTYNSQRWGTANEIFAIQVENTFLKARRAWTRTDHNGYFSWQKFLEKPIGFQLLEAISYGADGSVRELAEKQIAQGMLPEEYDSHQIASVNHWIGYYMSHYLTNRAEKTTIVSPDIDSAYRDEYLAHKNRALEVLITTLIDQHSNGLNLAIQLTEAVLRIAPTVDRLDIIPFVTELKAKIRK